MLSLSVGKKFSAVRGIMAAIVKCEPQDEQKSKKGRPAPGKGREKAEAGVGTAEQGEQAGWEGPALSYGRYQKDNQKGLVGTRLVQWPL